MDHGFPTKEEKMLLDFLGEANEAGFIGKMLYQPWDGGPFKIINPHIHLILRSVFTGAHIPF